MRNILLICMSLFLLVGCRFDSSDGSGYRFRAIGDLEKLTQLNHALILLHDRMHENGIVAVRRSGNGVVAKKDFGSNFTEAHGILIADTFGLIESELSMILFESAFFDVMTGDFRVSLNLFFDIGNSERRSVEILIGPDRMIVDGEYYEGLPMKVVVLDTFESMVLVLFHES